VSETRESALFRVRRKRATARDGRTFITTASERRRASSLVFVFVVVFVVVVVEADRQTDRSVAGRQAGRQGSRKKKQGDER
jgi:hypothetical protein